jgi:hypothetical protein
MVNLIVGFLIWRCPSIFVDVAMWEHRMFDSLRFLDVAKFTNLTSLSLLISCKLLFPTVGLKMSSLPTLALGSPNRISLWYLGIHQTHVPFPRRSCPSHHQFYLLLEQGHSEQ